MKTPCEACGSTWNTKRARYADGPHVFCWNCRYKRSRDNKNQRTGLDKQKTRVLLGGRCFSCGDTESLEVHHIQPISLGGTNDPDNLALYCHECHVGLHTGKLP